MEVVAASKWEWRKREGEGAGRDRKEEFGVLVGLVFNCYGSFLELEGKWDWMDTAWGAGELGYILLTIFFFAAVF